MSETIINIKTVYGHGLIIVPSRIMDGELVFSASNRVEVTNMHLNRKEALKVAKAIIKFCKGEK